VRASACTVKVPIRVQSEPDYSRDVYQPLATIYEDDDPAPNDDSALAGDDPAHDPAPNDDPAPAGDDPVPAHDPEDNDDPAANDDPAPVDHENDDPAPNDDPVPANERVMIRSREDQVLEMLMNPSSKHSVDEEQSGQPPEPKPVRRTWHDAEFWEELTDSVCMFSLYDIDRTGFLRRNKKHYIYIYIILYYPKAQAPLPPAPRRLLPNVLECYPWRGSKGMPMRSPRGATGVQRGSQGAKGRGGLPRGGGGLRP